MLTFLGLDLAWNDTGMPSALAVLRGDENRVELCRVLDDLRDDQHVLTAIADNASPDAVLAIDAPLVISNEKGQRPCDTEIGRRFGHADASAHSPNLTLFPNARSVCLTLRLTTTGWRHQVEPSSDRRQLGRWLFEVYPHPAHVVLFDLPRIIKYKKGRVNLKRAGLDTLRQAIIANLCAAAPVLEDGSVLRDLTQRSLAAIRGAKLKAYEDSLNALLCAFVAAHYWTWGAERNEMIGTMRDGYIVV